MDQLREYVAEGDAVYGDGTQLASIAEYAGHRFANNRTMLDLNFVRGKKFSHALCSNLIVL